MSDSEENEQQQQRHTPALERLIQNFVIGMCMSKSLPSATIYRVPEEIRKLKESAYTPRLVPIGPLHKHLETSPIRDIKRRYVSILCRRAAGKLPTADLGLSVKQRIHLFGIHMKQVLADCFQAMKDSVAEAKESYAVYVDDLIKDNNKGDDEDEVVTMEEIMLVDGLFILELLYSYYVSSNCGEGERNTTEDPYFDNKMTRVTVQHDLLLLENQLPFFVLEKLFDLTVAKIQPDTSLSLKDYVLLYLGNKMSPPDYETSTSTEATNCCFSSSECCVLPIYRDTKEKASSGEMKKVEEKKYRHILHVIHDDYLRFNPPREKGTRLFIPCASELDYAGIKFKPGSGENLFNVKFGKSPGFFGRFHRAEFEIPKLLIDDSTELFLRNLIAYEQCCPDVPNYFTSYAFLMGSLINTEKDIQVLGNTGILRNYLGANEEASELFNKLCKEVVLGDFYFAETCREAVEYSQGCLPKNIAHVKRTYFASPWTFIAFCVAFIAFGMGVSQFILSFI